MINSCGTGKPTEADGERERGSGRKRRQLFGLFGCSGGGGSLPPHGQRRAERSPHRHPVRRIGERSEAPPQLSFSCAVVFAAVACRRQRLEAIPPTTAKSTAGGKKSTADAGVRLVGLQQQRRQKIHRRRTFK